MAGKYPEIGVENFGPIKRGKVELKPLTVFIGPNNSGKSYLALLISSLFKLKFRTKYPIDLITDNVNDITKSLLELTKLTNIEYDSIHSSQVDLEDLSSFCLDENDFTEDGIIISEKNIERICSSIIKRTYGSRLFKIIEEQFSSNIYNLRQGKNRIRMSLQDNYFSISVLINKKQRSITLNYKPEIFKIVYNKVKNESYSFFFSKEDGVFYTDNDCLKNIDKYNDIEDEEFLRTINSLIYRVFYALYLEKLTTVINKRSLYTPAGRLGFLQGRKLIVGETIRKIPLIGIGKIEVPTFNAPVADFLARLIELTDSNPPGSLYQLAKDLEIELLGGEIILDSKNEKGSTEIKFKFQDTIIPLHRASSTVSEIASLILDLKYYVQPGSILIIEEPETHLHPGNQRILAKYLAKLVRNDVQVLITTHSEIILEQLNNQLLQGELKESRSKKKLKSSYIKDDYLKKDEVGVYVFEKNTRVKSPGIYNVNAVEIDDENGISMDEFDRIKDSLYYETVRLRSKIER